MSDAKKYRLRAEFLADVLGLLDVIRQGSAGEVVSFVAAGRFPYPDVVAEIHCLRLELRTLRMMCELLEDGHVMVETLNHAEHFTAERAYGGYWDGPLLAKGELI